MGHCFYHPDREAVAVCSKCGKPLCKECALEYNGKIYCKDCLEEIKKEDAENEKTRKKEEITKESKFKETPRPDTENADRKAAKIVLVAIVVSALVIGGIVLLAILSHSRSTGKFSQNGSGSFYGNNFSEPFNGTSLSIKANVNKSGINIKNSDEIGKIEVIGKNTHPEVTLKGDMLTITYSNFFPWNSHKDREITVLIPQNVKSADVNIKSEIGSASVSLPDTEIGNLEIDTVVGSTYIESCKSDYLKISSSVGSAELKNSSASNCTIKCTTGTCTINGGEFGILSVKEGTGSFGIFSVKRIKDFSFIGGAGEFNADFSETLPPMYATIKTGMGQTEIKLAITPPV